MPHRKPSILLGVTIDQSIMLMRGLPELLVDSGWEVHLVSGPGPALSSFHGKPGINAHAIKMARHPAPMSDLRALVRWILLMRRLRPDVISVGTPKAGLLGVLAALTIRGAKRVYVLRGLRLETSGGAARIVLSALEKLTMAASTRVLAVSPSLKTTVVNMKLAPASKISVLGPGSSNGVLLERFSPNRFPPDVRERLRHLTGLVPDVPVIGFVGRLTTDKGIDVLAKCRPHLIKAGLDHQLLILGTAEGRSAEQWLKKLNRVGRPVIMTGFVEDPAPYYQLMDVLTLPTLREGFPNVALEAQASGVPVVTTDATGAVDSVRADMSGRIIPVGDHRALGEALAQTVSRPRQFDQQQIIKAVWPFDRAVVQARHLEFYTELLTGRIRQN